MANNLIDLENVPCGTLDFFRMYAKEIIKWNASVKLVSIGDASSEDFLIERHMMDSLQIINLIRMGDTVVDIGSGAGFPGFVIAALSDSSVTLIEPNYKKAAFLRHISQKFLVKCNVEQHRSEEYCYIDGNVDVITSRAFASITKVINSSMHNISRNTKVVFFKSGLQLERELKEFALLYDFNLQLFASEINTESKIVVLSKIKLK